MNPFVYLGTDRHSVFQVKQEFIPRRPGHYLVNRCRLLSAMYAPTSEQAQDFQTYHFLWTYLGAYAPFRGERRFGSSSFGTP